MSVVVLHLLIANNLYAKFEGVGGREKREKIPKEFEYLRQFLPESSGDNACVGWIQYGFLFMQAAHGVEKRLKSRNLGDFGIKDA